MEQNIKIFLSHSVKNYDVAKNIKLFLEQFGLDVFLAHSDIVPSKQWPEELYHNLRECRVFMPLLTKEFKESEWTDQESGIAYNIGKRIVIVPLMVGNIKPYGFLSEVQALRLNLEKFTWRDNDSRVKIVEFIVKLFLKRMREPLIFSLDKTISWVISKTRFKLLKEMEYSEPFSKEEINRIMEESMNNNQIYDAEGVKEYLGELVKKYENEIEISLKEKVIGKIEEDKAREMLGGKSEAGQPILYGTPKQKLKQLEGYGGKGIEEMREEIRKEIKEEEKEPSLVDGLKKHL